MQKFIAGANIERLRRLIAEEPDAAKRDHLERMLVEEQARLQTYETHSGSSSSQDQATGDTNQAR